MSKLERIRNVVLAGVIGLFAYSTQATTINLSTGLDALDNLITTSNAPDAHWTVDQPRGGTAPAKIMTTASPGAAIPPWAADGPGSSWIAIDANSSGNAPVIPYTYYRMFTLSAADAASVLITGTWGIDDTGEVRLNGNLISGPNITDYSASTPFSVGSGSGFFVAGLNTLTITMTTSDNFLEAVRLEATLQSVPTPGAFIGGGVLLLGLLGMRRVRRA